MKSLLPEWLVEFRRQHLVNRPITRFFDRRRLASFRKHRRAVFVTFADGNVFKSERLQNEILQTRFFDAIHAYSATSLGADFYETFSAHVRHPRGFGYWCWKPYVIQKVLYGLNDGDLLVYADSGCTVCQNASQVLDRILLQLLKSKDAIVVAHNKECDNPIVEWTKADLLDHFGYLQNRDVLNSRQWEAGRLAMIKSAPILDLMNRWCDLASNLHLIDDSPSEFLEHAEFREHRHDQSILSLLLLHHSVSPGLEAVFDATRLRI
jgi:hypothetical protein